MLLDSNILIYGVTQQYRGLLEPYIKNTDNAVSLVSKLEVLGFHRLIESDKVEFTDIFSSLKVIDIHTTFVEMAIGFRQRKSMSLGDALIAATALEQGLPLVTRNTDDFKWIAGLQLVNPFK